MQTQPQKAVGGADAERSCRRRWCGGYGFRQWRMVCRGHGEAAAAWRCHGAWTSGRPSGQQHCSRCVADPDSGKASAMHLVAWLRSSRHRRCVADCVIGAPAPGSARWSPAWRVVGGRGIIVAWGWLTEGQGGVRPAPAARGRRAKGGALPRVGESTYDGRAGDQTGNAMIHDGAIAFADCTIMKPICLPSCPESPSVVAAARVRPAGTGLAQVTQITHPNEVAPCPPPTPCST